MTTGKIQRARHIKRLREVGRAVERLIAQAEADPDHIEFYDREVATLAEAVEHEARHCCNESDECIIEEILKQIPERF